MDPSAGSDDTWPSDQVLEDQQDRLETQVTRLARRVHRLQGRLCQRHIAKHVQAFVRHHQLNISPSEASAASTTAGQLKANLEHLEEDYDSDATESSSGGESCDDGFSLLEESGHHGAHNHNSNNTFPTKNSHRSQLKDNLAWRWAVERGAIASRWMWLLAQVHDLELKIRQQNEVYRKLRSNKGAIIIEPRSRGAHNQASTAICNNNSSSRSALPPASVSASSSSTSTSTSTVTTNEAPSSLQPPTPTTISASSNNEDSDSEPSSCVRTMPVRVPRRRQLVRASVALASATRKIARQTTVQCSCSSLPSLVSPCVLCNGRYSYVQVIDTNCMPQNERIAILDPSCHSVLTLPYQISLGLHFSKFLRKETIPKNHTSVKKKKSLSNSEKSNGMSANNKAINNTGKGSSGSSVPKSQTVISKLKKKYEGHERKRGRPPGPVKSKSRERRESSSNGSADSSRHGSPLPSPLPTEPAPRRRRSDLQHAYDIDNIVIPYHMACAPRIEKPQYKEIITPKWREIDIASVKMELDEEMLEDLSDASFAERHLRCEMEEKRRFLLLCAMGKRRVSTDPAESENHEQKPIE